MPSKLLNITDSVESENGVLVRFYNRADRNAYLLRVTKQEKETLDEMRETYGCLHDARVENELASTWLRELEATRATQVSAEYTICH